MPVATTTTTPDLDYAPTDYPHGRHRDTTFLVQRVETALLAEVERVRPRRVLDVGCGMGLQAARMAAPGRLVLGVEPSAEMIGAGRFLDIETPVRFVRAVAESLPFASGTFDVAITQGALDHFADPYAFASEAARVLRPGGRLIVALSNYESLSCRLGRATHRLRPSPATRRSDRPYWEIPEDHTVKGDLTFLKGLAPALRLERCYGISLLWLFSRWGAILDRLPRRSAATLWAALDKLARPAPGLADVIVGVWLKG